ncbi:hypothetical protein BJV78DRAFT_1350560 [Lactifluus subvellereus]|nr:hypothetical protein BJV78DRAFT_1350560 [Lactifluus subvellereus]
MTFHKPLISLVAALAATSSVAAFAVLAPRGNSSTYPPPPLTPISTNQCDTDSVQCCNTFTSGNNPLVVLLSRLLRLPVDPSLGVGLSCTPALDSADFFECNGSLLCCSNIPQGGLISVGCTPINPGL